MHILKEIHNIKMISAIKPIEGSLLYDFITEQKPYSIIETGMGKSTLYFLAAIQKNEKGLLLSIDLCEIDGDHDYTNRLDKTIDNLKQVFDEKFVANHWTPVIDNSSQTLVDIEGCDVFMHDSKHTYDHLCAELTLANKFNHRPEWFICHDCVHDFAQNVFKQKWFRYQWKSFRRARHLEIFRRYS